MISFSEYVQINQNKAYNHKEVNIPTVPVKKKVIIQTPIKEKDVFDYLNEIKPDVWTAKIIKEEKFLFFNEHYLNISKLKQELSDLYNKNGYSNYGFSKLDESELIRYTSVRDILAKEFDSAFDGNELDPSKIAYTIYQNELKDFDWKPEPLILR